MEQNKLNSENDYFQQSFELIIEKAEESKQNKQYEKALELLGLAKERIKGNAKLNNHLPFIISRQALCTYKLKKPTELEALKKGLAILEALKPSLSQDVEIIGLSGAMNKRMFEITQEIKYLDHAIEFYEKGFELKKDYYNGINAAYMNYKKASILKNQNEEWLDVKSKADNITNSVLSIAKDFELKPDFFNSKDEIWILLTIAEAYHYQKNKAKMEEYEVNAKNLAKKNNDKFAIESYKEQKEKIEKMDWL